MPPHGVINVLGNLAQIAWAQKPDDEAFETLFVAIFAAFKKAQPEYDLKGFAEVASASLIQFIRSRFDGPFRDLLRRSTYLTPVGDIAAEVQAIHERVVARIGLALGKALQKARR